MNKELSKAIMISARLRNKLFKYLTEGNRNLYTHQRNHCVSLLTKAKENFKKKLTKNMLHLFIYLFILFNFCLKLTKTSRIHIPGHLHENIATQNIINER